MEAPPPAGQPPARRPARQGHRERRRAEAPGAAAPAPPEPRARPQRHRRYLARDGRRRRGTAALRLGLYGGGLGPFRRCPRPPSATSGAFFGNLRRGQSALGNRRREPLRVFPASSRRRMTRAISASGPQPFRPPSYALPHPRHFPSLSVPFRLFLRPTPATSAVPAGRGVATLQSYKTPVTPQTFLGFIIPLGFITSTLSCTSGAPSAARPALAQPTREELARRSLWRRNTLACGTAQGYQRYIRPAQARRGPFPRRWRSGRAQRVGRHGLRGPEVRRGPPRPQ